MPPLGPTMPACFGPGVMPDETLVPRAELVAIGFVTSAGAAARLLPRYFELTDPPTVSLTRIDYHGVDYLGGRGYREIVLAIAARPHGGDAGRAGRFAPVMWVNEVGALISGRELMGFAKLPAEMEPIAQQPDGRRFACAEYGTPLIEGWASALRPLPPDALARINRAVAEVRTFGWKLIPGDGRPDVDHPTVNVTRWRYRRAWEGEGGLVFHRPDARSAPLSAAVLAGLAELPVLAMRPAFAAEGSVVIDRRATRRLNVAAEPVA